MKQQISTCLWFDDQAEEAAKFYTSIFKNSSIGKSARYPEGAPGPEGKVMTVEFTLNGREFLALNGGPIFNFTEAISLVVNCDSQEEIDNYWNKLLEGGEESMCGWLKDKYGLSWQIVPAKTGEWLSKDAETTKRVMDKVMKMRKLDMNVMQKAFEG